jgi:hypothetical protein
VADAHLLLSKYSLTETISFVSRNAFMFVTTTDQTLESRTQHNDKMTELTTA